MSRDSSRRSSWRSSISSLADLLKEHHAAVNGAYAALHGGPRQHPARHDVPRVSYSPEDRHYRHFRDAPLPSRRRTTIQTRELWGPELVDDVDERPRRPGLARRLSSKWDAVKEMAKEHHRAVNGAYQSYYGLGVNRRKMEAGMVR
jgi:hypothetical protein